MWPTSLSPTVACYRVRLRHNIQTRHHEWRISRSLTHEGFVLCMIRADRPRSHMGHIQDGLPPLLHGADNTLYGSPHQLRCLHQLSIEPLAILPGLIELTSQQSRNQTACKQLQAAKSRPSQNADFPQLYLDTEASKALTYHHICTRANAIHYSSVFLNRSLYIYGASAHTSGAEHVQ